MRSKLSRSRWAAQAVTTFLMGTLLFAICEAQDRDRSTAPQAGASAENRGEKAVQVRAPETLVQLNNALVGLADKVSQGVVQILVTGYGPLEDNSRTETAFIARQRAIGSGVIVDPSGYVMTNAHVVEGARRIRIVLPVPSSESATLEPEGKRRILEAKLVGAHQETDLALLKVDGETCRH
jgi:serine protease Do